MTEYIEVKIDIFDYTGQPAKIRTDITVDVLIQEILKEFDDLDRKTPEAYALYLKGTNKPFERNQKIAQLDLQMQDELELRYARTSARNSIEGLPEAYIEELSTHRRFKIAWQPAIIGRKSEDPVYSELLAVDLSYLPFGNRVSRNNAQITADKLGYYIEPLSFNNPISILGETEPVLIKRLLQPRDQICLGNRQIILKFDYGNLDKIENLPKARLIVLESPIPEYVGLTCEIEKSETILGRMECDFAFPNDSKISRKHASILYQEDTRTYRVLDLGSSNGVWVRDNLLPVNGSVELKNGDVVGLGPNMKLIFELT